MDSVVISWIGGRDLHGVQDATGPVLATLRAIQPSCVYLLYNYPKAEVAAYLDWLSAQVACEVVATHAELTSPIEFGEIYEAAEALLARVWAKHPVAKRMLLLSPGTPAMQAVWILLGKTQYQAHFLQSSEEQGVRLIDLPFSIAAEFQPQIARPYLPPLEKLIAAEPPSSADFDRIVTSYPPLLELKQRAAVLARYEVPVLILGETGTGKELFARAIHNSSPRASKPFIALNCGALPPELIDSTLFGHVRGAFTGAAQERLGVFEQANEGTVFLDEFGELPLPAQVRLLRVLQEGVVQRVGDLRERSVSVRLIAATHRDLQRAVADKQFREDLFYRVAVGVLELPPLRSRRGDLFLLVDHILNDIKATLRLAETPFLSPGARNVLLAHRWTGNVRELHATLLRAALWCASGRLEAGDIRAVLIGGKSETSDLSPGRLEDGFSLDALLGKIERGYLQRALEQSGGVKVQAARLLGLKSHQVLQNRLRKHGLDEEVSGQ